MPDICETVFFIFILNYNIDCIYFTAPDAHSKITVSSMMLKAKILKHQKLIPKLLESWYKFNKKKTKQNGSDIDLKIKKNKII